LFGLRWIVEPGGYAKRLTIYTGSGPRLGRVITLRPVWRQPVCVVLLWVLGVFSCLQGISSSALYSPGAERSCLCSTRIQGQSPKLCFGRVSLYSPNWSFGLACCFAPCSSWRLGCGPCYQGPLPYSTVYGGPIRFPIDKPPSISWLSFKGRVVVDLIRVLLEVKSWDGLLWFFFWLMCTFAEKSALSECSPRASAVWHKKLEGLSVLMSSEFFSFECSECNFCIECSPRASCFLVQKAGGSKN